MPNQKNGFTKEDKEQKSSNPGQEYYQDINNHKEEDNQQNNDDLYEKMGDNPSGNRIQEDYQHKK